MQRPTFRFAPSPNGLLHLGHAYSALIGFEMARRMGGRFLVRIEDLDAGRSRAAFVAAIFDDLRWLGISWDEPVVCQSQNGAAYRAAADRLKQLGLIYPCFATRAEITAAARGGGKDPDGAPVYPGLFRGASEAEIEKRLAAGEVPAWRLNMEKALAHIKSYGVKELSFVAIDANGAEERVMAHPERWGDCVIVRKDAPASYHLAVVVDDHAQGVSHVTRGRDLLAATDVQRLLQVLLELEGPRYHHHALILDDEGRKLSKSSGAVGLAALRGQGVSVAQVKELIGLGPPAGAK